MQFFPAMGAGPGQSFSGGFRSEFQDAMPGSDFSGFLSREFEQPVPEAPRPFEAAPLNEPEAPEASHRAWDENAAACEQRHDSPTANEVPADPAEAQDMANRDLPGQGEPAAKAAGPEKKQDGEGRDDARAADASDDQVPENASSAGDAHAAEAAESDGSEVAELKADLAEVAREASGRAAANPEVAARIEALHDLLRQFQDSAPAERKELAVTLGDRIKALRELLAGSAVEAKAAPGVSGKAVGQAASDAAVGSGRMAAGEAEAALSGSARKSSGRPDRGDGRQTAKTGEHVSGAAADGKPGATLREADSGNRGKAVADEGGATHKTGEQSVAEGVTGRSVVAGPKASEDKATDSAQGRGVSQRRVSGAGENAADRAPEAVKRSHSAEQAGVSGAVEGKGQAQPRQEMTAPEGERAAAADQALRDAGRQSRDDAALKAAKDAATREGARNGSAAAGLADRGQQAREKADAQNQPLATGGPQEGDGRLRGGAAAGDAGGDRQRQDARNGFFGPRAAEKAAQSKPGPGVTGKVVSEIESQLQGAGLNSQPTVNASRPESPVSARSAEVYRQVESGAFRNLGQGVRQLVLHLDPVDLGQVSVILRVKGKEVQAVLRASSQETSQALGEQMAQLRTQLESQGLKVGKLEVQTQMADSQEQSQWQGAEQHNRYQENRELALSAQRWRTMERLDGGLVRDVQNAPQREKLSSSGLDIFA